MLWFNDRFKIALGEAFDACVDVNRSFMGSCRRYSATLTAIYMSHGGELDYPLNNKKLVPYHMSAFCLAPD